MKIYNSILLTALTFSALSANAETMSFDDIAVPVRQGYIGTTGELGSYGGFVWSNLLAYDASRIREATVGQTDYTRGFYSANTSGNVAVMVESFGFDHAFSEITRVDGGLFDFGSAQMAAAWQEGLSVTVTGWLNNQQTASQTFVLSTESPFLANFGLTGVDRVTFTSFGGNPQKQYGYTHSYQFAMDDLNLSVAAAVPEPSTYAMMVAGLGAIGLIARRRKIQA